MPHSIVSVSSVVRARTTPSSSSIELVDADDDPLDAAVALDLERGAQEAELDPLRLARRLALGEAR